MIANKKIYWITIDCNGVPELFSKFKLAKDYLFGRYGNDLIFVDKIRNSYCYEWQGNLEQCYIYKCEVVK